MARRKARLTLKKPRKKALVKDSSDTLSPHEFATLPEEYGKFSIEDPTHESIEFSIGNTAYIRWQDLKEDAVVPERDYWIGKVMKIRGYDADDVWVCVQWFWSPQDVAEVVQSFDPSICAEYEVLTSDNTDIISVYCFVAHVEVKLFQENLVDQIPIGEGEWFARYNFMYNGKRISPKVTQDACAICRIPYTPGKNKILLFCPRQNCRQFYHHVCLVKNNYVEQTRSHRLLETWPDCQKKISMKRICDMFPPKKRQRRDCVAESRSNDSADPLLGFPAQLIAIADQHIIRGAEEGGIVGNITSVIAARRLIYTALKEGFDVLDDWEERVDATLPLLEMPDESNTICPSCLSPI